MSTTYYCERVKYFQTATTRFEPDVLTIWNSAYLMSDQVGAFMIDQLCARHLVRSV